MYLVAVSDTIGLEYREDMYRVEFSVYVFGYGGRRIMAVECHTQYRHKPTRLYAEIAHHDCPLLCVATMCSDES